jgi:hypothetical protein
MNLMGSTGKVSTTTTKKLKLKNVYTQKRKSKSRVAYMLEFSCKSITILLFHLYEFELNLYIRRKKNNSLKKQIN